MTVLEKINILLHSIDESYAAAEGNSSSMEIKPLELGNVHRLIISSLAHYQHLQVEFGDTGKPSSKNYAVKHFWVESGCLTDPIGINNAQELINAIIELNGIAPPEPAPYGLKLIDPIPERIDEIKEQFRQFELGDTKPRNYHKISIFESLKGLCGDKSVRISSDELARRFEMPPSTILQTCKYLHNNGLISMTRKSITGRKPYTYKILGAV